MVSSWAGTYVPCLVTLIILAIRLLHTLENTRRQDPQPAEIATELPRLYSFTRLAPFSPATHGQSGEGPSEAAQQPPPRAPPLPPVLSRPLSNRWCRFLQGGVEETKPGVMGGCSLSPKRSLGDDICGDGLMHVGVCVVLNPVPSRHLRLPYLTLLSPLVFIFSPPF